MTILLTGATGSIGSAIANTLTDHNRQVIAAVRNPDKAREKLPAGIAIREFDFNRPDTFAPALEGINSIYLIASVGDPALAFEFLDQVDEADIDYLVFNSGRTTGNVPGKPLHEIENRIKRGKTPYTIIQPGWFMQNFLTWLGPDIRERNLIALPAGDAGTTFVDTRDLAAAASNLFLQPAPHLGKTYEWVGSESLTHYAVAEILTQTLGREINYQALSEAEYTRLLLNAGATETGAEATNFLYRQVRAGEEEESTDHLQSNLGHPPTSFHQFAEDHKDQW